MCRYIVIVGMSRGFAIRLMNFLAVSRACDKISSFSISHFNLDFFVNFNPGKSISTSFKNFFLNFLREHVPRPPRTGLTTDSLIRI